MHGEGGRTIGVNSEVMVLVEHHIVYMLSPDLSRWTRCPALDAPAVII